MMLPMFKIFKTYYLLCYLPSKCLKNNDGNRAIQRKRMAKQLIREQHTVHRLGEITTDTCTVHQWYNFPRRCRPISAALKIENYQNPQRPGWNVAFCRNKPTNQFYYFRICGYRCLLLPRCPKRELHARLFAKTWTDFWQKPWERTLVGRLLPEF
jgi:hypothetical protein